MLIVPSQSGKSQRRQPRCSRDPCPRALRPGASRRPAFARYPVGEIRQRRSEKHLSAVLTEHARSQDDLDQAEKHLKEARPRCFFAQSWLFHEKATEGSSTTKKTFLVQFFIMGKVHATGYPWPLDLSNTVSRPFGCPSPA